MLGDEWKEKVEYQSLGHVASEMYKWKLHPPPGLEHDPAYAKGHWSLMGPTFTSHIYPKFDNDDL